MFPRLSKFTFLLASLALFAALAGCGGGEPEDDGQTIPPAPDCKTRPELCR